MSKWPMRGHFGHLHFKTFPMTPRTLQYKVFWALLSNTKHSGVSKDSKSPTLGVLGFTPTLGQSGVATYYYWSNPNDNITSMFAHHFALLIVHVSSRDINDTWCTTPLVRAFPFVHTSATCIIIVNQCWIISPICFFAFYFFQSKLIYLLFALFISCTTFPYQLQPSPLFSLGTRILILNFIRKQIIFYSHWFMKDEKAIDGKEGLP
jgi:hypothetical protein